jgi:hypothetical protein
VAKQPRKIRSKYDPEFVPKAKTDLGALRLQLEPWLERAKVKRQTVYLGVDPGLEGGFALMTPTSRLVFPIPTYEVPRKRSDYQMAKLMKAAKKRAKKTSKPLKEPERYGKASEYDDETILDILDLVFTRSLAVVATVEQCEAIVSLSFKRKGAFEAKQAEGGEGAADSSDGSTPKVNRDVGVATGMWPLALKALGRRYGNLAHFAWPESSRWKKALGVHAQGWVQGRSKKEKSINLTRYLWPKTKVGERKSDHNLAEAMLVAYYGMQRRLLAEEAFQQLKEKYTRDAA